MMTLKFLIPLTCLALAACGGDDPIVVEEIAEEPDRKDIAMLCDLYVQRLSTQTDESAEAGFDAMERLGISEKGIEKARESRERGREEYVEGVEECCKVFNKDVKDLTDMQTAYVYADLVLSSITRDMMTPAMQRQARSLRETSEDNMTRPERNAAYDVRASLPKCEKVVANDVSRENTQRIKDIMDKYKK
ncbi:MAG: hypothetical protein AAF337_02960 [Pseudomonadota bacterium]